MWDTKIKRESFYNNKKLLIFLCTILIATPIYLSFPNNNYYYAATVATEESLQYAYSSLTVAQKDYYRNQMNVSFEKFLKSDYKTKDYDETNSYVVVFEVESEDNNLTINDLMKVFFAYRHDHPELYWISTIYAYSSGSKPTVYICMDTEYAKASYRKQCDLLISKKVKEYLETAKKYNTKYDKIKAVHDKIITEVDYVYDKRGKASEEIWAHNILGVFQEKGAVCEGYAKAFQYILNLLKIPNIYVIGEAGGSGHAWNLVELDSKYYCIDITWNDMASDYSGISYIYFFMPGNKFAINHTAYRHTMDPKGGKWLYSLPSVSNSNEYTYYVKYDSLAESIDPSNLEDFLAKAIMSEQGEYLHILADAKSKQIFLRTFPNGGYEYKNYGYMFLLSKEDAKKMVHPSKLIAEKKISEHIYFDATYKYPVTDIVTLNANTGVLGRSTNKTEKTTVLFYTDITGNVIVGVTTSSQPPVIEENKIIDSIAARKAKATIKEGVITVRAMKETGNVYLWIVDAKDNKIMGYGMIEIQ